MSKIKEFLEIDELIKTIKSKGIKIENMEKVKDILSQNNYYVIMEYKSLFLDINHKYLTKTFKIFKNQIEEKKNDNLAVSYYKDIYNFVPFWVITKVLSFGLVKELYGILKDDDKVAIKNEISNFNDIKIKGLFTSMQLLVDMRNKTAHDEIVYNS